MPRPTPELDREALTGWLDKQELGTGPLEVEFLNGGAQNLIWILRRGDWQAVLRIPPAKAPETRDEGILREWRITAALQDSDVPSAAAIAVCPDASVLGRSFYLMGFVDGWSPMSMPDRKWPEPFLSDPAQRQGLAYELVNGVAAMAMFDWKKDLGDFGRPEGFHERQVARWSTVFEKIKGRELPGYDEATAWLSARAPKDFHPGLMHGDYQFANVMFGNGAPASLAAIVDWEMGTIGDPKLDLAWATYSWPADTTEASRASYVDLTGMPSRSELLAHWSSATGRQTEDMDYYYVLAQWKLAIVLEQGFQRAADDPKLKGFGDHVLRVMHAAGELAATSDYR